MDHHVCLDYANRGVLRGCGEREHEAVSAVVDGDANASSP
jgi:hypothetical protein